MYCSSCGVSVAQGLKYCNYCGAKLSGVKGNDQIASPDVKPERLVASMIACFIFGLLAIVMMMGMMRSILGLNPGLILLFAMLGFMIMLLIEGVCIRLLFRRKGPATTEAGDSVQLKGQATKELGGAPARVLSEPVPSVTEHTTRAFAPLPSERTSK
jgi:hypothetical protein